MTRVLVVALLLAAALAAEAGACSCAGGTPPEERVKGSDIAFVGTLQSTRESDQGDPRYRGDERQIHTFRVDEVYKGQLGETVEVETSSHGGTCGFTPDKGERIGLLLHGGPPYSAGICDLISPEDLERTRTPPPKPLGSGRIAFLLGGHFSGTRRLMAFDADGRFLAYGRGGGGAYDVCPGSRYVVEAGRTLAIRRLSDLRIVRRRSLPADVTDVKCLSRGGGRVAVSRMFDSTIRKRPGVLVLEGRRKRTLARGTQPYVAWGEREALVIDGLSGDLRLLAASYATGRRRVLGRFAELPHFLTISPDGRHAAFVAQDISDVRRSVPTRLVVVDLVTREVSDHELSEADHGKLVWLDAGRLLLAPADPEDDGVTAPARIFDTSPAQIAEMPSWYVQSGVVVGDDLWTIGSGYLERSRPPQEGPSKVLLIPSEGADEILAVPGRPAFSTARASAQRACVSRRGPLAGP